MSKEKFIAATVTTLVLFSIVRFFTPDDHVVDFPKVAENELEAEAELLDEEKKVLMKEVSSAEVVVTPKKSLKLVEDEGPLKEKGGFSIKSKFVYYKIKDGLALVGGDVVLGEVSEDKKGLYEGKLIKDEPLKSKLWDSAQIPYGFNEGFPKELRGKVLKAVSYFNKETVMEFVEADSLIDEDVIVFKYRPDAPCSSYLGRVGGLQPIYLKSDCSTDDVLHEIMHALGFVHEQQREGRDRVLEILWDNIQEEFKYNFSLLPDSLVHQYVGSVFDVNLGSIMMYHDEAFAKPGLKSIKPVSNLKIPNNSSGLSVIDKKRLEFLYGD